MSLWSSFEEPYGVMMALMPVSLAERWGGSDASPGNETTDYDKVQTKCDRKYAAVHKTEDRIVLLFGGDKLPLGWLSKSDSCLIIARIVCTPALPIAIEHADQVPHERPLDTIDHISLDDGLYRMIDVVLPGNEAIWASDEIRLLPGNYSLTTWEVQRHPETEIIIQRLELSDPAKRMPGRKRRV